MHETYMEANHCVYNYGRLFSMKKNIYLSAPALFCCAGRNRNELYESCLNGYQGGLAMRKLFGCDSEFPVGLIDGEALLQYAGERKFYRIINAALEQLSPAVEKVLSKYGKERIGVCLGSCDNGSEATLEAHKAFIEKNAFPEGYNLSFQSASLPAEYISNKFGLTGPAFTIATACASGASAILRGAELMRCGYCDAVIVGGADIVSETVFSGFYALEAVSDTLTNPFSKNRKGINFGEGAAFFLLDSDEISGVELLGAGESSDAYHMTAPSLDGSGPAKAMKNALKDAEIQTAQIGYINLHGTGTPLNDEAESLALKEVFGDTLPLASSTKPVTGHTLGAAGALEAAICWMVLTEQRGLPVHCWDGVKDGEMSFHPVAAPDQERAAGVSICMSNNYAFGGCNVSLILGRKS